MPTREQLVFYELGDLLDVNNQLGQVFYEKFQPTPNQDRVFELIRTSEVPPGQWIHLLLFGGTGSSKSWTALSWTMRVLLQYPGARALGVRRTHVDLKLSLYKEAYEFLDNWEVRYVKNDGETRIALPNNSEFWMRSDKALVGAGKDKSDALGSTSYSMAILEEADSVSEELANTIPSRMRQNAGPFRKIIFYICNPPSKSHWLYKKFFKDNNPDDPKSHFRAIRMPVEGNNKLPEGYIEGIERDYARTPALYKRFREGLFGPDVKGNPIFQDYFERKTHVASQSLIPLWNKDFPIQRCWDFGWRHSAIVVMQDDKDRCQIRVLKVVMGEKVLLEEFAEIHLSRLAEIFPNADWEDYCDPAGVQRTGTSAKSYVDILRGKGLNPRFMTTSVEYGINIIAEQFRTMTRGRPVLLIDPECEIMIEALELGYCNEKDATKDEIKPVKDGFYDHVIDAWRYGMIFLRSPGSPQGKRQPLNKRPVFVTLPDDGNGPEYPKRGKGISVPSRKGGRVPVTGFHRSRL